MCLHKVPMNKIEGHLHRWRGVSAYTAAVLLARMGFGHDTMFWKQAEKCPSDIVKSDEFKNICARDVGDFNFICGPPGKKRIIRGNLLMLFIDRVLLSEAEGSKALPNIHTPIRC